MLLAAALDSLLRVCAPTIGARTMTAIVRVESGGNSLAIHDNTLDRAFAPRDVPEAVAWTQQLVGLHHSVDLGLAQINNANLPRLGMSIREAFDPCTNLRGGATILGADYRQAANQFGPGQFALRRAIGAYNTGSLYAGYSYVAKILAAAGLSAENDFHVPDLAPIDGTTAAAANSPTRIAGSGFTPRRVAPARPAVTYRRAASPPVSDAPPPSPILIEVTHVDAAARQRAIAAAANPAPAVQAARGAAADAGPIVLHVSGQPDPPAAVPVVITGN